MKTRLSPKALKAIAANVKAGMERGGLSQSELARALNVSPSSVHQLLNCTNLNPTGGLLEAVANELGVTLAQLVTDPEEFKELGGHDLADCLDVVRGVLSEMDLKVIEKKKP